MTWVFADWRRKPKRPHPVGAAFLVCFWFPVRACSAFLKAQSYSELTDARRSCAQHSTKCCWRIDVGAGVGELNVVEDVEELGPESKLKALAYQWSTLGQSEVRIELSGPTQDIARGSSVGAGSWSYSSTSANEAGIAEGSSIEIQIGWVRLGIENHDRSNQICAYQIAIAGAGGAGPS
jgi:hypothetical protein